jgi:hypothetical protein
VAASVQAAVGRSNADRGRSAWAALRGGAASGMAISRQLRPFCLAR